MKKVLALILLSLFLSIPAQASQDYYDPQDYKDVIFFNQDKIETISLYKGKHLLIMFWATWCPHCKYQMPAFSLLKDKYKDNENIEFIALSTDEGGFKTVDSYFKSNNLENLGNFHDSKRNLFRSLGLRGVPTILLFSKKGDIMKSYKGLKYIDIEELDRLVSENKISN